MKTLDEHIENLNTELPGVLTDVAIEFIHVVYAMLKFENAVDATATELAKLDKSVLEEVCAKLDNYKQEGSKDASADTISEEIKNEVRKNKGALDANVIKLRQLIMDKILLFIEGHEPSGVKRNPTKLFLSALDLLSLHNAHSKLTFTLWFNVPILQKDLNLFGAFLVRGDFNSADRPDRTIPIYLDRSLKEGQIRVE